MTPGLSQTIAPALDLHTEQRLAAILSTYRALKIDCDLLEAQMEEEKAKVFAELDLAGIDKTKIAEFSLAVTGGTTPTFDKQKFVALGGDLSVYDRAIVRNPKKRSLRISTGKERPTEGEA